VLSWVFSIVSLANCKFLVVQSSANGAESSSSGVGIFSFEANDGTCRSWSNTNALDSSARAVQAFSVLTSISLGVALAGITLVLFVVQDTIARIVWNVTRTLYMVAFLETFVTLFLYINSVGVCLNDETVVCSYGPAGKVTLLNVLFLASILSVCFFVPVPSNKPLRSRKESRERATAVRFDLS
jgi:hypothetical protein